MVDPPKDLPTSESITPEAIRVREELARGEGPMLRLGEDDQKKMEELLAAADELKKDTDPDAFQTLVGQVEDLGKRVNLAMQMAGQRREPERPNLFSDSGPGTHVSPADLTVTPGSSTARTSTWDITDQGDYDGVTRYCERTFYDSTAHKHRVAHWTETNDSNGLLVAVSAETLADVTAMTECDDT